MAQVVAVVCGIVAQRGRPWWELQAGEVTELARALDPPLARIPLPEKELGVVAELGALGFCCFAIFAPRMQADSAQRKAIAASRQVVSEAERVTAQHAAAPYADTSPLDRLRRDDTAVNLDGFAGVTVGDTDPDLITRADAAAREAGLTPERIVELRRDVGIGGELLDSYPSELTFENGEPLPRGLPGE